MEKITTILFTILALLFFWETAVGQTTILSDNFETGNLSQWTYSESHWEASDTDPINGTYSLRHADLEIESSSTISTSINADDISTKVTTWQFNLRYDDFDPSGGNYFGVAIMADNPVEETFNGYMIGINFTGSTDEIMLYKVTNGSYSVLINSGFDWDENDLIGIKVERNSSGIWKLFYDMSGNFDDLVLGGSIEDTDHNLFSHLFLFTEYSSTRSGLFSADDIFIQQVDETIKAEPSDHVTGFTATGSIKSVNLSWSDVSGSPTPDGYLIKASDDGFGSITNPTDGDTEADDADLADGSATLNVLQGIEEAFFEGLDESTTYYFKIYPYTNSGSDIDYKIDSVPQDDATTLDAPDIILNEFLADPPAGADPNGDGNPSISEDEFIEFVNIGDSDLDITGWTIEEEGGLAHTFPSTVLKPSQPVVVFSGGSADGYFGGAIVQISSEGGFILNNGNDSIILKNDSGIEIINYSYGGEAGNDQSVTRNPDLSGNFEEHASADPGGSDYSPGTQIAGFSFLPRIEINGNEGWRMLSTPTSNNSFDDLLNPIWTQGSSTGADYPAGEPNVVTFDGSDFHAVEDLTENMTPGEGFMIFVYGDDDFDPGTSDTFPKILEMTGTENSGTFTPDLNSGSETASLVGNPYLKPINWDLLDKADLSGTVYVYDHSYGTPDTDDAEAAGVAGSYRTWNGDAGSLADGRIAPFQGFWVINNSGSPSPSLTIEESDQIVGGTFYKEQMAHTISIQLKAETKNMYNEAFLSFNDHGRIGKDNYDGLELTPLDHADYLSLATETEETLLDINNLPAELEKSVDIPLHVQAFEAIESGWTPQGGEITLTWPSIQNIPAEWSLFLTDEQTGKEINLKETDSYTFILDETASNNVDKKPFNPFKTHPIQREKPYRQNRFTLAINPNAGNENNQEIIPERFALEQNYPNPFNPSTNIRYETADIADVELNVYNVMGQKVATLVDETKAPGAYEVTWNASDRASGIYYYQLNVSGVVFTRQMTLIK